MSKLTRDVFRSLRAGGSGWCTEDWFEALCAHIEAQDKAARDMVERGSWNTERDSCEFCYTRDPDNHEKGCEWDVLRATLLPEATDE